MSNVHFQSHWGGKPPVEKGSEPPHDGPMDSRLAVLEALIPNLATKADVEGVRSDLHRMDASIVRWMIATVLTLFLGFAGLFFTMQSSINSALERTAKSLAQPESMRSTSQSVQPVIIQMPTPPHSPAQAPP